MRSYTCSLCGVSTTSLAEHILDAHYDIVLENPTNHRELADILGVSRWTARKVKTLAGLDPVKRCARCGEVYKNKSAHLLEKHMPLLYCARYILKLEQANVAAMFFASEVTTHDISKAFQVVKEKCLYIGIDLDDLPEIGIPIIIENNKVRVMEVGEVGIGHIYVDEGISWLQP